jgi:hypothetical protein
MNLLCTVYNTQQDTNNKNLRHDYPYSLQLIIHCHSINTQHHK